ncbi:XRE family transcriptional regulator [bacterium 1xD42-67]|nr:XRE family transcriptional regulator [bacterium 1xD42-67]
MPKDKLALLGEYLRSVRNAANLTQEQLSDLSHVSVKHIADIEKGQKNPSFIVLQALAKVLDLSLDNLIIENISAEEQGLNQLKSYYLSCPPEMRETFLNMAHAFMKELTVLSEKRNKQ